MNAHGNNWISPDCVSGLVSIIIPTYNRENYLRETIPSVVDQTYTKWECIVVDDGSTDGTKQLMQMFVDKHGSEKMRYFRQENKGAPVARNRGIEESKGEFILFLDSDDLLDPETLRSSVAVAQASGCDIVYTPLKYFSQKEKRSHFSRPFYTSPMPINDYLEAELRGWHPLLPCFLFRRKAVRAVGPWDTTLGRHEDGDYAFRMALAGFQPVLSLGGLALVRNHSGPRIGSVAREVQDSALETIFAKVERELTNSGRLEQYGAHLACQYLLRAVQISGHNQKLAAKFLARTRALGPPSTPIGSLKYRIFWWVFGPQLTTRLSNFLWRLKSRLGRYGN